MMKSRGSLASQWGKAAYGEAAIEFGLMAPVLLILLAGLIEIGFSVLQAMQVQDAVEAGAVYVSKYGFNAAGITNAVVNATEATGMTATPAPTEFCGCPAASGITTVACSTTCASGSPPGQYVQINAALAHTTILPYLGLPLPATLTAQSIVRVN